MSGLVIDRARCVGCGRCLSACPAGALALEEGTALVDRGLCTLCARCVDSCPVGAISVERGSTGPSEGWRGVWVFAQQEGGRPLPVALELLSRGRQLADQLGEPLCAVAAGEGEELTRPLLEQGADLVYLCPPLSGDHRAEPAWTELLTRLTAEHRPAVLLFGATPFGRSLAPRLAARLGTGLTADCTELDIDPDSRCLLQTRPAFGGNLMATIVCPDRRPQMATVRPGVLPISAPCPRPGARVVRVAPPILPAPLTRVLGEWTADPSAAGLVGAEVIVTVGRGIGVRKNLALARRLAELLGARLGCSRPLVEAGWLSYDHQVGQTGVSVAPKLLLAFGVSGAVQHLAGITGAEHIIAVNSDPEAPIFSIAHEAVVADCVEVMGEMIDILEKKTNKC